MSEPKKVKPPPELPLGNTSVFHGISENFSFHASPESFITSRVLEIQRTNPDAITSRTPIRARILNRNVAVISSYSQIKQILEDPRNEGENPPYVACAAYNDLMASFFPPPNLLLSDGMAHGKMRRDWDRKMEGFMGRVDGKARSIIKEHFESISSEKKHIDLYESMKDLAWKLLLGIFLNAERSDAEFDTCVKLHEDLLRGQFSLFPVQVNLGLWHSPRKIGVDARKKLQHFIRERLSTVSGSCPFEVSSDEEKLEPIADHTLLFTSSLAVKALASLLTAFLLNLYVHRGVDGQCLAEELARCEDPLERRNRLQSVLSETERLSPPIVGIMRRCSQSNIIQSEGSQPDVSLPSGWEAWLYFVGANRDAAAFGETCDIFDADRYRDASTSRPMVFGMGAKSCLGTHLVRHLAMAVAETILSLVLNLGPVELPRGVRGWLGWDAQVDPETWAADMKQLPTQRPKQPILISLTARSP